MTDSRWLLRYARNVSSQNGEDGIIEKILEVLGEPTRWCVEFGAWDGRHLSNVYHLVADRGYSAVLIEGSEKRYRDLAGTLGGTERVIAVNQYVGFSKQDGLDAILGQTSIPDEFDVLSIDIDGNDYHVWRAVERYRPRIVVIEYNPTVPSAVDFVQPADMSINQGASMRALARLASGKGYELVSATAHNCLFVERRYFDRFGIRDNSIDAIRPDESLVTYIFNGFDGTVFVRGHGKLAWHGVSYRELKLQQIPRAFRRFPDSMKGLRKVLAKHFRSLRKHGWI